MFNANYVIITIAGTSSQSFGSVR